MRLKHHRSKHSTRAMSSAQSKTAFVTDNPKNYKSWHRTKRSQKRKSNNRPAQKKKSKLKNKNKSTRTQSCSAATATYAIPVANAYYVKPPSNPHVVAFHEQLRALTERIALNPDNTCICPSECNNRCCPYSSGNLVLQRYNLPHVPSISNKSSFEHQHTFI